MNSTQINMTKSIQVKFSKFLQKHSLNLNKPTVKFMKDITNGIIKSQSCIVRQISQTLSEKISLKKTQERLTYQLDNEKELEKIRKNMLIQNCRKLKKESLIIVDPSDIIKPNATKMEGLNRVRDGNDGKYKPGYDIIDIVGVNQTSSQPSLFPIHSDIHSNKIGFDTLKNKIFDIILNIIIFSNNSGIFVMDRGFDDKKVIEEFYRLGAAFIIRMKVNRSVFYKGILMNIKDVADHIKKKHKFIISDKTTIKAGVSEVGVPLSRHKVKNPDQAKVYLVSAEITTKHDNKKSTKGNFMLLVSLPDSIYTDYEICKLALESYKLRWKIEEIHRQVKTDFGWEKIQLLKFNRLRALNTLLWLALSFIYELDDWKYKFANAFSNLMLDKKSNLKILEKFIYYRITKVIRFCFLQTRLFKKKSIFKRRKCNEQITLSF